MDIICARTGKHFNNIEAVKECQKHCQTCELPKEEHHWHTRKDSHGKDAQFVPSEQSHMRPKEWDALMKLVNKPEASTVQPTTEPKPITIDTPKPIIQSSPNMEPVGTENSARPAKSKVSQPPISPADNKRRPDNKKVSKNQNHKTLTTQAPNWLIALILIFALSSIGLAINLWVGNPIPFWLLFGFSFIYSLERWFTYITRKYIAISMLYRLLLNLLILSSLGLLIWSSIKLFSQQLVQSPLAGSLIFLAEIIFFLWMWRIVSKNKRRRPSMKITIFSLIVLFLVFAFAGVQPISDYKDTLLGKVRTLFSSVANTPKNPSGNPLPTSVSPVTITPLAQLKTPIITVTPAPIKPPEAVLPKIESPKTVSAIESERMTFDMINAQRKNASLPLTVWNDQLYKLSLAHTQDMAKRGEIFHTPMDAPYGENAWGGKGYYRYGNQELAKVIVDSWMSSPLHKAWILHAPLRTSVVSIVVTSDGQYSSWTFWTNEAGAGPQLVQRAYNLWQAETGGRTDWITWLYNIKGYPNNPAFLKQLGIQ